MKYILWLPLIISHLSNVQKSFMYKQSDIYTWKWDGSSLTWRTKLHRATEDRSSVHSVSRGSRFTLLQKGWIDWPEIKYFMSLRNIDIERKHMQSKAHQYYFICYLLNGDFPSTLSNSVVQNHSLVHVPILSRQPARNLACTIPCLPLMPLLSLNILDFGYAFPSLPHSSSMKNVNRYRQT